MKQILETLAQRRDLSAEQATAAFTALMDGALTPGTAGALLMGLRSKGETEVELAAMVDVCLARARKVPGIQGPCIDTCGTGGDNRSSFNCSTATALVLAAMGYRVVKHGNRSVSGVCGSADVLEALGLPVKVEPAEVAPALERTGFAFLFAPHYHPAFRHVMPLRRELAIRTLFNLLGPLLNPARPTHQVLGVAAPELMPLVARTLVRTGVQRAAVVHGAGGFDELTPFGPNRILWVRDGEIHEEFVDGASLGLSGGKPENVAVADKLEAVQVLRALLDGYGPIVMQHMLTLNLAVAIALLDDVPLEQAAFKASSALFERVAVSRFGISHD